jgi:hypothetical protein
MGQMTHEYPPKKDSSIHSPRRQKRKNSICFSSRLRVLGAAAEIKLSIITM